MLRLRDFVINAAAVIILTNGLAPAQHKRTSEVTLTRCWQFPTGDLVGLTTDGRDLFASVETGHVIALSAAGEKLWDTDLGGEITPGIVVRAGFVAVTTRSLSGALVERRLSATTGVPASGLQNTDPPPTGAPGKTAGDTTTSASGSEGLIVGNDSGLVTSLSGSGPVWKFKTGGAISAILAVEGRFVVISRDNFVYSLRANNGDLEWKRRLTARVAHYALTKNYLIVSSMDQHGATLVDLESGRVAGQLVIGGDDQVILDPVVTGDSLTIATSVGLSGYSLAGCGQKETVPIGQDRTQKQF